jgi:TolA-binding protein
LKSKASLKLAYAYQQNGNNEQAEKQYTNYIASYPSASDREEALDALRSLYVLENRPEAYAAYLKENNLPETDAESVENSFYDAATQNYGDANWEKAAAGFTKYLDRFPNGKYAVKAHFYRAESYYNLKQSDKALADYDAVQTSGWSDYAEAAAGKSARISFANKDYGKALTSYRELRNVAMDDKILATAYEGMMKSAFESGRYENASAYADTLLSLPNMDKDITAQAQLIKARALQLDQQTAPAIALYQILDTKNLGMISAEARYRYAEILFSQHKLKEAETQAGYAAQASGGYDYWVVKCYILLGDILTEEKDYFNAKATLKSIVKNTKIKELKEEAAQKLDQVIILEKAKSKLQED